MTDAWTDIATEFLHFYPRGTRLLAVAGADAGRSRRTADDLAAALIAAGQSVERVHSDDVDSPALRDVVISPFRANDTAGTVLIVSGPAALLGPEARGMWNFTLWQLAGDEQPHTIASALVDVTDPEHPTRRFADYCAFPAAFGS